MRELKQKILFEKREFKLTSEGIEMYCNDLEDESTSFFHFDEFSNEYKTYTEKFPKIMYLGLSLLLAGYLRTVILIDTEISRSLLSGQLIALSGILLVAFYYLYQKEYILLNLDNEKQLFILAKKPNKETVDEFIKTFYEMRKVNYRKRYFIINTDNDQQKEIDRMNWLRKEDIISESELEFMLEEIKIKFL